MEKINQSNKKIMFWFLVILNLIMSITDLVLTYIGTPDLSIEGNPLVYQFGLGWKSLIISSLVFLAIIVMLLYYTFFRFKRIVIQCEGLKQYISMLFYNRPDKFILALYKFPKSKTGLSYLGASLGYVLAIIIPIVKLFAVFLWVGIIINLNIVKYYHNYFNILMTPLGRSDAFVGGIILALVVWYYWFSKEYKINKKALENGMKY
jgi:hypothetical protein